MTDFKSALFRAGFVTSNGLIDRKAATDALGVSERTLERWIKTNKPHECAIKLLEERTNGGIPQYGPWRGYRICRDNYLWTPSGRRYDPTYLEKVWILQQSNRFKDSTIMNLRAEIEHLRTLVESRDRLKEIGNELIDISTNWDFATQLQRSFSENAAFEKSLSGEE